MYKRLHKILSKSLHTSFNRQIRLYEEGARSGLFDFLRRTSDLSFGREAALLKKNSTIKERAHMSVRRSHDDSPNYSIWTRRPPRRDFDTSLQNLRVRNRQVLLPDDGNVFILTDRQLGQRTRIISLTVPVGRSSTNEEVPRVYSSLYRVCSTGQTPGSQEASFKDAI